MSRITSKFSLMPFVVRDHSPRVAYGMALVFSVLAIWISEAYWSLSGAGKAHTMLPLAAVFISAVTAGLLPGILSLMITTAGLLYSLAPTGTSMNQNRAELVWLGMYVLFSLGAAGLGAALKTALQTGKKASEKLEKEVAIRTADLSHSNDELRRLVTELEESRGFLDSLVDNIPLLVYVKSANDFKVLRLNKAARLMAEQNSDHIIGKTSFEIFPKGIAERLAQGDQEALTSHSIVELEETVSSARLGSRIMSVKKVPLFDRHGKAAYILAIAEDVTEKKRNEEQRLKLAYERAARIEAERKKWELEEAVRARDTFLSICSHELKTPLTSLKLQTGMIRMLFEKCDFEALRAPKIREIVLDADKEINRINRLINDMLDVSRIRSGKLSMHPESVNLRDLVCEVVEHFRSNPAYQGIPINIVAPTDIIGVWDRTRIEQIVINLVSNALKYGERKPVGVSIKMNKNKAYLSVKDYGLGISPEDQKRIFQRFERAAASESISGLGLGLYIVKEIVTMHGGQIRVESEVARGSCFTVELPLKSEAWPKAA